MKKMEILRFSEVMTHDFLPVLSYFYEDSFSLHGIRVQSPPKGPLNHIIFGKLI